MKNTMKLSLVSIAAVIGLTGCGLSPSTGTVPAVGPGKIQPVAGNSEKVEVTVTSKSFTEQLLLGKITVDRKSVV
mgnify:CR=1 FL=1